MKGIVHYSKVVADDGRVVALLTMDNPPMNSLSSGTRAGLVARTAEALRDDSVSAIVVTGKNGPFCAGVDIAEGGDFVLEPIIATLEASTKPVIAAIDGVALGGGLEVALGCHFRIASVRSVAGWPEINLGLCAGTQRMPRLIGVEAALDFNTSGVNIPAHAAAQLGVYDAVATGDNAAVIQAAVNLALSKVHTDLAPRRLSTLTVSAPPSEVVERKRSQMAAARPGEVAPPAIISCLLAATDRPFAEGLALEAEYFDALQSGDQCKALQYMFFAERECAKVPGLTEKPGPLKVAGVVGAGIMGGGIAMCCAEAGMQVFVLDKDPAALDRGMAVIRKNYSRSVERKSKTQAQVDKLMALFNPTSSYADLATCDIVVEAVFENMKVKEEIFRSFDDVCKSGCILASNTSGLNIDQIASATKRPEDVVGCHFFSPANVMKLLENVRGAKSSQRTIATAMAFGKKLGKVTCLAGNCPGFIANRVMGVSGAQALLQSGVHPEEVDAAAEAFGMKMGSFRMADLVGLDLFGRERERSGQAKPDLVVADALFAAGRYGQKTGKGYYQYDEKRRVRRDPEADAIIAKVWERNGVRPRNLDRDAIIQELYFPVINEGFLCLEEGFATRPSDIDVCLLYGYNWPRYRGGPMQYATAVGLAHVLEVLRQMGVKPAKLLVDCVENSWSLEGKELKEHLASARSSKL